MSKKPEAIETLTQPVPLAHELYRHYKGGEYMVLSVSTHTETKELMVNYVSLTYGTLWTRPLTVWNNFVDVGADDCRLFPRFQKIQRRTK